MTDETAGQPGVRPGVRGAAPIDPRAPRSCLPFTQRIPPMIAGRRTWPSGSSSRMRKNPFLPRLLKKVQMQGGARGEVRGVLRPYVAAPRERANAADGPFSAA